ncbi:MAG: thiamine pyrophosphate-binding protein, partial [Cyanobacteria bacterium P01_F01_bin.150]
GEQGSGGAGEQGSGGAGEQGSGGAGEQGSGGAGEQGSGSVGAVRSPSWEGLGVGSAFRSTERSRRSLPFAFNWFDIEKEVRGYFDRVFVEMEDLREPKVAWWLARYLPEGTPLFISNSMPVRDMEWFWPLGDRHIQPYVNRGANGIDGIVSTALGVAHRDRPSVLLTGDLAFLHDTNGLLMQAKLKGHLTIVLINNNGGGIFEMLPISQMEPPFEEFFATPQVVAVSSLCQAYDIDHMVIKSWPHLAQCFSKWSFESTPYSREEAKEGVEVGPKEGIRVLEIRCDRRSDNQLRQALLKREWQ